MAFPRRLLNEGEEVVLDLRPHWWFFAGPAAALVAALAALIALTVLFDVEWPQWVAGVAAIGALLWVVGRYGRWVTTNMVLTNDRLIYRSGVIAKKGIEIPLERINTVFFNQSMFERLLRAGDLVVESGGERGRQSFSDIRRPNMVQNEIHRQIEDNQDRMYGGARRDEPRNEPLSLPEQLEQLDGLRQRGVITQAEFEAKKAQLLERM